MTELFYIQNKGNVGDCLLWWREGGAGYTTNLSEAMICNRDDAESICNNRPGEDVMWPATAVKLAATPQVRRCDFARCIEALPAFFMRAPK